VRPRTQPGAGSSRSRPAMVTAITRKRTRLLRPGGRTSRHPRGAARHDDRGYGPSRTVSERSPSSSAAVIPAVTSQPRCLSERRPSRPPRADLRHARRVTPHRTGRADHRRRGQMTFRLRRTGRDDADVEGFPPLTSAFVVNHCTAIRSYRPGAASHGSPRLVGDLDVERWLYSLMGERGFQCSQYGERRFLRCSSQWCAR
jgi:hypothetical protein